MPYIDAAEGDFIGYSIKFYSQPYNLADVPTFWYYSAEDGKFYSPSGLIEEDADRLNKKDMIWPISKFGYE